MMSDDFVLIRSSTPFTLTSDPTVRPVDIEAAVAGTEKTWLSLGEGEHSPFRRPGPGSEFVIARLIELILVEILRTRRYAWTMNILGCSPG
jgi:hypothetical protein